MSEQYENSFEKRRLDGAVDLLRAILSEAEELAHDSQRVHTDASNTGAGDIEQRTNRFFEQNPWILPRLTVEWVVSAAQLAERAMDHCVEALAELPPDRRERERKIVLAAVSDLLSTSHSALLAAAPPATEEADDSSDAEPVK